VRAERCERREAQRAVRMAGTRRVREQIRAVLRQTRCAVADQEAFAEFGRGLEVAALHGFGKCVDCVVMAAGEVVLLGLAEGGVHRRYCGGPKATRGRPTAWHNRPARDKPRTAGCHRNVRVHSVNFAYGAGGAKARSSAATP
jgi:hypothetical protein